MRSAFIGSAVLFAAAAAWIALTLTSYLATWNPSIIDTWLSRMDSIASWYGKAGLVLYWMMHFICPLGLLAGFRVLRKKIAHSGHCGLLVGMVAGLWCSSLVFSVPYFGHYPNLPAGALVTVLSAGIIAGPGFYPGIIVCNCILWPLIGYFAGLLLHQRLSVDGLCYYCDYDLTGNTTGICPECGERTDKDRRPRSRGSTR